MERRKELGGFVPARTEKATSITVPELNDYKEITEGTGDREISTTMAFVRMLTLMTKDKKFGNQSHLHFYDLVHFLSSDAVSGIVFVEPKWS